METTTFNIITWIRARRLRWVGHILRLDNKRLIKQTLKVIWNFRQEGDILMDVEEDVEWRQLLKQAARRDGWRERVNELKKPAKRKTKPKISTTIEECDSTHIIAVTRFTFFP